MLQTDDGADGSPLANRPGGLGAGGSRTRAVGVRAASSALALTLSVAALGAASCRKASPPTPPPPVVRTVTVEPRDVEQTYEWLATLDGSTNADIRPQVTGTVVAVNYLEGTVVRVGEVLFTIDRRPFVAAVERAAGNYESALAQLGKARADVARYTPLLEQHAISREQVENARAAVQTGIGNVQAAKGALDSARLDLEWTQVRSPIQGLAGIAQTRVGNLVTPNQVLTTVSTLDPIRASYSISEREYLAHAEVLNSVNDPKYVDRRYLELILLDGRVYPERARRVVVNRQIDPATGTLLIQALFPNPGNILRPGLFAKVRLHTGVDRNVLVVPEQAVQQLQGTYRVAVVGPDQRVRVQQIAVGPLLGHDYVVERGLRAGEAVVVEGLQNAQPGALVRVEKASAPGTAAAARAAGPDATTASPSSAPGAAAPPPSSSPSRQGRAPPPTSPGSRGR